MHRKTAINATEVRAAFRNGSPTAFSIGKYYVGLCLCSPPTRGIKITGFLTHASIDFDNDSGRYLTAKDSVTVRVVPMKNEPPTEWTAFSIGKWDSAHDNWGKGQNNQARSGPTNHKSNF
jgi:hypothetical protein